MTVVVIGPTGSGKSKLGIELAQRFDGEVVNADAIQMYKGLDVATAKVTDEETMGVPHHLLSFLEPQQQATVREFRDLASSAIADIRARGKLPIVVGGTMYYVQSLLRPSLLEASDVVGRLKASATPTTAALSKPIQLDAPASEVCHHPHFNPTCMHTTYYARCRLVGAYEAQLYERLKLVDPDMANRLHPNDARKVRAPAGRCVVPACFESSVCFS